MCYLQRSSSAGAADCSPEVMEARRQWHSLSLHVLKGKENFPKFYTQCKYPLGMMVPVRNFHMKKKNKRISSQQIFSIRMTKGSSSKKESDNKQKSGTAGMKKE